jgi:hypothetical protein
MGFVTVFAFLTGCGSHYFPNDTARDVMIVPPDGRVEFAVDEDGRVQEVEFHCKAADVPQAVLQAADQAYSGGRIVDCEKEHRDGDVYYEVTKEINGREFEVLVTPKGFIERREIEVDAGTLPQTVNAAADQAVPGGRRTKSEEIRDEENELEEYHVKIERQGLRFKVVLTPEGRVLRVLRETLAEIEVPVQLSRQ